MNHPWNLSTIQPVPEMVAMRQNKWQVFEWVREAFEVMHGDVPEHLGRCVYWTHAGCFILRCCGYRALLQAGTMSWPMAPDRGNNATHFSYLWKGPTQVLPGIMAELHSWIGLPDENQIIDFSTAEFKNSAVNVFGMNWEFPPAPPYLWTESETLPPGVIYQPKIEAIRYLINKLSSDRVSPALKKTFDVEVQTRRA